MRCLLVVLNFILSIHSLSSQTDIHEEYIDHQVFLLGNLSDNLSGIDISHALSEDLPTDHTFTLIINGDLISKNLDQELQFDLITKVVRKIASFPNGFMVIIPGDADWDYGRETGFSSVVNLEKRVKKFVKDQNIKNIKWVLKKGCPGPNDISLSQHLKIITLNTQWWNHREDKPTPTTGECEFAETSHIKEEIEDLLEKNKNKNVLILGHHPIISLGNYGGHFSFGNELSPFPLIGSFINAFHAHVGSNMDISNARLRIYSSMIQEILVSHQNLVYASSHEKNQQIIKLRDNYLINSGALFSSSHASKDRNALLSSEELGIIRINYSANGEVSSTFLEFDPEANKLSESYHHLLFGSTCSDAQTPPGTVRNFAFSPCENPTLSNSSALAPISKTVRTVASDDYTKGGFHKFFFGTRYRKDWAQEIEVPVLSLAEHNTLTPLKKGGGRQTTSLKLISEKGDVYAFRSVNKDPSKALAYDVRNTLVGSIFKDQTSAQQPYGSLIIAPLLEPLNILHASPILYLMPDSDALGKYRSTFGGMLGTLEEHPGKPNNQGELFGGADKIVKSNDLFSKLYSNNNHQVDADEFIRARLFDILVGDWSKHEDNWKWAAYKQEGITNYRPIPRDRDMVLSKWNGVLPFLADLPFGITNIEEFDHKIRGFRSQVFQARFLDRFITAELNKEDFTAQAKIIQNELSDEVILASVQKLPKEIYDLSGDEIVSHLKQRRDDLGKYAETYFDWLNSDVEIVGSNEKDHFTVEILGKEQLRVKIYNSKEDKALNKPFFSRTFNSSETKQIRVYGLNKSDSYEIIGLENCKINIILIGGHGHDSYSFSPTIKHLSIYDLDQLQNTSKLSKHYKRDWNHSNYIYERGSLKFDTWIPSFSLGYSSFQGVSIGIGNSWTNHRWNKRNFSSKHSLSGIYTSLNSIGFSYKGEWNEVFKKWSIKANSVIGNPRLTNSFYGLGNESEFNKSLDTNNFFLTNFWEYSGTIGQGKSI